MSIGREAAAPARSARAVRARCVPRRAGYLRLRTDATVEQIRQDYPAATRSASEGEQGDEAMFLAALNAFQAMPGEIKPESITRMLLTAVVEHAGVERAVLLETREGEVWLAGEACAGGGGVEVSTRTRRARTEEIPLELVEQVSRTLAPAMREVPATNDASGRDAHLGWRTAGAALCIPLVTNGQPSGCLYLEGSTKPQVLTERTIAFLALLGSHAAIALENAQLRAELGKESHSEEALRNSEKRFRALVEHDADAIVMLDRDLKVLYSSPAAEKVYGYKAEAVLGRVALEFFEPPDREEVRALLAEAHRRPREILHDVRHLARPDGSRGWVESTVRNLLDEPAVGAIVVNGRDVTAQREALEGLQEARTELARITRATMLGALVASIAHEVNQPIGAVVTSAAAARRWLDHQPPDVEHAQLCLDRIANEGKRAAEIVRRIRELVRKTPAEMISLDLNQVLLEVVRLTRSEMRRKGVTLELQLAPSLPCITGDRVQLQQVVLNLTLNALEAMATHSGARQLQIRSGTREDGQVVVEVSDTGKGLDPQATEGLFEAFFTTKPGGIGMGLAISRSIIEAHQGTLSARPNTPVGAVFSFTLPATGS